MPRAVKNSSQHISLPLEKDSLFVPLCKDGGRHSRYNAPNDLIEDRPLMGENQDLFVPKFPNSPRRATVQSPCKPANAIALTCIFIRIA
jgi:hypothetical protein